jgi:hypothetical protein
VITRRGELQDKLEAVLGSPNVYFQPPASLQMRYPCIVYKRDNTRTIFADNSTYKNTKRYLVTVIDADPDSKVHEKLLETFPLCSNDRFFTADDLNHDVFNLFF